MDSNCRPLVSEATALPTEPQPLPCYSEKFASRKVNCTLQFEGMSLELIQFKQTLRIKRMPCR